MIDLSRLRSETEKIKLRQSCFFQLQRYPQKEQQMPQIKRKGHKQPPTAQKPCLRGAD